MDRVVVIGGSGFLGSHICEYYYDKGHEVVNVDKNNNGKDINPYEWIDVDILNEVCLLSDIVYNDDIVIYCAGIMDLNVDACLSIDNITTTTTILELCRFKAKRFVFASSLYVNGAMGGFYRCSKQACELYIQEFGRRYNLNYLIARFGSLYGTRANEYNYIHRIIKSAIENGYIQYHGTGEELREYVHVRDAARVIFDNTYTDKKHITITGNNAITSRQVINTINEMLGNKLTVDYQNKEDSNHYKYTPFNFEPISGERIAVNYTDFSQGLLEVMNEIKNNIS